ncbi:MAG TPA: cysteine--1-D-myo-inosityl 2-amino-2-deoxy-alpha-D-glucopyranoside ligase [Mycobacteriales bacterium]|nr:cysteine--1-D-myo-inosityl 2-amino-2-deoxy-alpha-D-glucopyranoside ligase [Mycobacteriales bacterium]
MDAWPGPTIPALPGRGLPVRVWDTATGQLRPLAPGPIATMYVCGITPYDATHLGHAATYLTFDTLLRVLRDGGHEVRYVQNVTDVDDPLFERAAQTGEDWRALATREIALFRTDMQALRIVPPHAYVSVSEAVPLVVAMVQRLLAVGAAYELDGDIYSMVGADPHFGSVGRYDRATMITLAAERGGDPERPGKKDPLDALLWRAERPGEPSWPSPFGPGRPGWHVECAAIAVGHLGPTIDVNGGGRDLIFPHHEHSASHATLATGSWPFARTYLHQAMVGLNGHKMSKSRGNLVLVSALRQAGIDPSAVRLAMLGHGYRQDWAWTDDDLPRATQRLAAWRAGTARTSGPDATPVVEQMRLALADDLDTPRALAAVDRWAADAANHRGRMEGAPGLLRDAVDALLGVRLQS